LQHLAEEPTWSSMMQVVDDAKCGRLIAGCEHAEFEQRLKGATLLTAKVLYCTPKHPTRLQTYLWPTLDEAPRFPRLEKVLNLSRREINAVIPSVRVASGQPLTPAAQRKVDAMIQRH
jgi:uncharacterized protein Usg